MSDEVDRRWGRLSAKATVASAFFGILVGIPSLKWIYDLAKPSESSKTTQAGVTTAPPPDPPSLPTSPTLETSPLAKTPPAADATPKAAVSAAQAESQEATPLPVNGPYLIVFGPFGTEDEASHVRMILTLRGYDSATTQNAPSSRAFEVVLGPQDDASLLNATLKKIGTVDGVQGRVVVRPENAQQLAR